jgi:hypothetical protein
MGTQEKGIQMRRPEDFGTEELLALITDAAKNWLAHDGLWFQAVERGHGLEEAMRLDREAWERFTVIEAQRIMARLGMEPGGGIPALVETLDFRLYAYINEQEVTEMTDTRCVFTMKNCRVQAARKRRGLEDFPCKSVGIVEYSGFARTIDHRIETRCLVCPPDDHPDDVWCSWEFVLKEET